MNEYPGFQGKVAVFRYGQAVDILTTIENLDGSNPVVKAVPPSPVIVDAKPANDRFAAGLANMCEMRYLRRLRSTTFALVIGNEERFPAFAIACHRLPEVFGSLSHVPLQI
jgi:hypothetical protein